MKRIGEYLRKFRFVFMIAAPMLAVLILQTLFFSHAQPMAVKGVLNLAGWDFQKQGSVRLDGEWEFFWGHLLTPDDYENGFSELPEKHYVTVPASWKQECEIDQHTSFGAATYRLHVKLDGDDLGLGLKITSIRMASRIYVNGVEVGSSGNPSAEKTEYVMRNVPYVISIYPTNGYLDIIIQVSDFDYKAGGIVQSIYLGSQQDIFSMAILGNFLSGFVAACLLVAGMYYMFIFLRRRGDRAALYYSAYVLCFFVFQLLYGEKALMQMLPQVPMEALFRVQNFMLFLSIMFVFLFVRQVREGIMPGWISKTLVFSFVGYSFMNFVLPISVLSITENLFLLPGLLLYVYLTIGLAVDIKRRRYGSWGKNGTVYLFSSFICVLINFLNNMLYVNNLRHDLFLGYTALFIFVILTSFMLSQQYNNAYATIQDMNIKLLELDKLKDEFLANTSHELRTPLNGIINLTQSVLDDPDSRLKQEHLDDLKVVIASGRRLNGLINDILDISTLKRGEIKLVVQPVDVRAVAAVILQVVARLSGGKQITFSNCIPDDLPSALADEARLGQIYYNLLGNAIKFTKSGEITAGGKDIGTHLELWVQDTGRGIDKDNLENIFVPFYKVGDETDSALFGTGLGLSITRQLVQMHGGEIRVQSQIGVGTRFTFTLPVSGKKREPAAPLSYPVAADDIVSLELPYIQKKTGGNSILIAEDDAASLRALLRILDGEGYSVTAVTDGQQALKCMEKQPLYDLIILDVMMPGLTGIQVLEQIRKRFSPIDIPVLLLTARTRPADIRVGLDSGANDYITKPFEADVLKARVRTLVQMKQSVRSAISMELAFLQAQINPHFLYNALSVISSLSTREPKQAKALILHLSDYLRGSFRFENHNGLTSLAAELNTLEAYLAIEKARFKDRLNIIYDIDEGIAATLPVLCLQPMVENAVKHGLMGKLEGGTVSITIRLVDGVLSIIIEDDGVGMTEEKVKTLLNSCCEKGVGLQNVHRRLMALYGHGVEIESAPMKGTRITILIPQSAERK